MNWMRASLSKRASLLAVADETLMDSMRSSCCSPLPFPNLVSGAACLSEVLLVSSAAGLESKVASWLLDAAPVVTSKSPPEGDVSSLLPLGSSRAGSSRGLASGSLSHPAWGPLGDLLPH